MAEILTILTVAMATPAVILGVSRFSEALTNFAHVARIEAKKSKGNRHYV